MFVSCHMPNLKSQGRQVGFFFFFCLLLKGILHKKWLKVVKTVFSGGFLLKERKRFARVGTIIQGRSGDRKQTYFCVRPYKFEVYEGLHTGTSINSKSLEPLSNMLNDSKAKHLSRLGTLVLTKCVSVNCLSNIIMFYLFYNMAVYIHARTRNIRRQVCSVRSQQTFHLGHTKSVCFL